MNYLQHKGATIAYRDIGNGSPVVFLHCSSATHKEWLFAANKLDRQFRCLLPDLMGYGRTSGQFDELGRAVPCRDTDILAAMVELAGEPVHIVAHSYGAATALEYATSNPDQVRSLVAIEPVSFHLLRDSAHQEDWKAVEQLARRIIETESTGRSRASARHYMSFWIGRLRWLLAPRRFKSSVVRSMSKVAFEFSLLPELTAGRRQLGAFDRPTTLVSGTQSPRPALAVIETLAAALPNQRRQTIGRAGHMLPFTHPDKVLSVVERHLAQCA